MKLSVIIPVYNGEKFIKRAYDSVKSQNLEEYNYEIVYIDNNSKDKSADLIKELMQTDPKVKLFNQPKQGEANARNKGIEMAQGDYFHQLDVDDELFPGALKKMIAVLDQNKEVEAVVGRMVKSHYDLENTIKPNDETNEVIFNDTPYWGVKWFLDLSSVVGEAAFMHRKSVFEKIGNYNVNISMGTDTAVDIKLGLLCNVAYINTYIYLYYKHFDSITAVSKRKINQVFHIWSRMTQADLPLFFEHDVPLKYKSHLFGQLYSTMAKIIFYTEGLSQRFKVYNKIQSDIKPLKLTFVIKFYLIILALFPISVLLKFYVYYLAPWYVKKNLNTQFNFKTD